ncbi:uncharacterized protein LOC116343332 [Contarinia nasturtii]|uniref:uncharacterized protein LOC116343332 n=1 Tax=Contarinia nasturtii TaxID=265458 RepID=UPI0012D3FECF|nr:uncharacterized protein LOC116343332 [Contarinia nasturtii]
MRPFIVIRQFESDDTIARKDLIRQYVMSFAFDAFTSCLFREIFLQLVVLVAAVMFIFFNFPLIICASSIPFVIIFIYISVYGAYLTKAIELSHDPITSCWIAEAYEPYLMSLSFNNDSLEYDIVPESRLQSTDFELNRMKRTLIGTISIESHRSLHGAGWLSHFAISSKFNFDKVAEPLIHRTLKHAIEQQFYSVEMVTTECQSQLREVLLKIGFDMKQIYHQYILANNNLRIMKSQMGIDLNTWTKSKNK